MVTAAAAVRPLLLVIDDVHLADRDSLRLLVYLGRQLRAHRILVLVGQRTSEIDRGIAWSESLGDIARIADSVDLGAFDAEETASLVRTLHPESAVDPDLVGRIHSRSGGLPLFAAELTKLALVGDLDDVPARIRDVIEHQVARFDPATRDVLTNAALLGMSSVLVELAPMCSTSKAAVLDALLAPLREGLILEGPLSGGTVQFSHGVVRQAILEHLPPAELVRRHLMAGAALEQAHREDLEPHTSRLAHHYVLGSDAGEVARAISYSTAAADLAARSLAFTEAARHLGNAVRLSGQSDRGGTPGFGSLLLKLGDAQWRSSDVAAADRTFRRALGVARETDTAGLFVRAVIGLCQSSAPYDERPDLVDLADQGLDRLAPDEHAARAELQAHRAELLAVSPVWFAQAVPEAQKAVAEARTSGDDYALCRSLLALANVIWAPETMTDREEIAEELFGIARRNEAAHLRLEALFIRYGCALAKGERADVVRAARAMLGTKRQFDGSPWAFKMSLLATWSAVFDGRLEQARSHLREARGLVDGAGDPIDQAPIVLAHSAVLHDDLQLSDIGEVADALLALAESLGQAMWAPAAFALSRAGRGDDARDAMRNGLRSVFAYPYQRSRLSAAVFLARTAIALGEVEGTEELYNLLVPYRRQMVIAGDGLLPLGPVALTLAEVAFARGEFDVAEQHARDSLDLATSMQAKVWTARSEFWLGRVLCVRQRWADGRARLESARRTAVEVDLPTLRVEVDRQFRDFATEFSRLPLPARLTRDGTHWTLDFADGEALLPRDTKGLRYLAVLLRTPDREYHVFDLVDVVEGVDADVDRRTLGDAGPVLDAQARDQYRRRLTELREQLEDAEAIGARPAAERAQAEIDSLISELSGGYGLGGRERVAASAAERARLNVTRAIRAAIKALAELSPTLGGHLEQSVRTGRFCCYEPRGDTSVDWRWD